MVTNNSHDLAGGDGSPTSVEFKCGAPRHISLAGIPWLPCPVLRACLQACNHASLPKDSPRARLPSPLDLLPPCDATKSRSMQAALCLRCPVQAAGGPQLGQRRGGAEHVPGGRPGQARQGAARPAARGADAVRPRPHLTHLTPHTAQPCMPAWRGETPPCGRATLVAADWASARCLDSGFTADDGHVNITMLSTLSNRRPWVTS